ncbi:MAG: hypothetical protein CMG74_10455 [Candidatus Marinimicrobia bacterium]|nr:hypothetical protein [Candidatus Neomarinimicrobiota bacterium]
MIANLKKLYNLLLKIIINNIIWILSFLIRKDYNKWVFGLDDGGGTKLAGNVWYLFKYINDNHSNINTTMITSSQYNLEYIRAQGYDVYKPNTWKAFLTILRSGVCIVASDMHNDLVNFSKKKTFKANVWHGMIIKKIGYASPKMIARRNNRSLIQKIIEFLNGYVDFKDYDFIACTSDAMIKPMEETFSNKNIYATGQPRDDAFFYKINRESILKKYKLDAIGNNKIISYLPTIRDVRKNDRDYYIFNDKENILTKMQDLNITIIQKNHYSRLKEIIINKNVYYLTDEIDTQELLCITDILITDYSSCYMDFLHTLKPIIFYPYDLDEYIKKDRGLYFDYYDEKITPGEKVFNEEDLFDSIKNYCKDVDLYKSKRNASLEFFHNWTDGRSSERTFKEIKRLVKEKYKLPVSR